MRSTPLILIADDEPGFQEIIASKLKRNGFLIAEAHSGSEAVEKAANLRPDLILMDVNMPGENGTEAVLDLLKNPDTKDIKIVFLTTMNEPWPGVKSDVQKFAHEIGAAGYINKTEDLEIIAEKVRAALNPESAAVKK